MSDLFELELDEQDCQKWLGIVLVGENAAPAIMERAARAPCTVLRLADGEAIRSTVIRAWLSRAVAYEYCGHERVAEIIANALSNAESSLYLRCIEITAVWACAITAPDRIAISELSQQTFQWYESEILKTLNISCEDLAAQALAEADRKRPLLPPRWLLRTSTPDRSTWSSLYRRIPADLRRTGLSCVSLPNAIAPEIARISRERGVQTVGELLSLELDTVGKFWERARDCELLQEALLETLPEHTQAAALAPAAAARSETARTPSAAGPLAMNPSSTTSTLAAVEQLLRSHGGPMTRTELIAALGASAQPVFYAMLGLRPFVELSSQVWGLIDRDVPGGDEAFDAALHLLRPTWSRRSSVTEDAVDAVRALSARHRSWSRDTIVTAIRCSRRQN